MSMLSNYFWSKTSTYRCYTLDIVQLKLIESETSQPTNSKDKNKRSLPPNSNPATGQWGDGARAGRVSSLTTPVQDWLYFIGFSKDKYIIRYINFLSISPNNERAQPIHALTPICGNPMYSKYFVHIAQIEAIFCTAWFLVSWTYIYYSILGYVNLC